MVFSFAKPFNGTFFLKPAAKFMLGHVKVKLYEQWAGFVWSSTIVSNLIIHQNIYLIKVSPPKVVPKPVHEESSQPEIEVLPSKSGILKRPKKMAHRPPHSPERSSSFSPKFTSKHQILWQGVAIRDVQIHVSPASKKRIVKDLAKKISKNRKRKVVEDSSEDVVPESPIWDTDMGVPSPKRNSPIKSNFELIGNSSGSVKTSNVDITTNLCDPPKVSTPEQIVVILPKVSHTV